jgi:hypothetical protein
MEWLHFDWFLLVNLLNYPEEQVIAYTPDVDDVIKDQLQERLGL